VGLRHQPEREREGAALARARPMAGLGPKREAGGKGKWAAHGVKADAARVVGLDPRQPKRTRRSS
jgi:hypothetical protein